MYRDTPALVPFLLFGFLCLISAGLTCLLPETLDQNLPDTIEQAATQVVHGRKAAIQIEQGGAGSYTGRTG